MPKVNGNAGLADVISELTKALTFDPFAAIIRSIETSWRFQNANRVSTDVDVRVNVVPRPGRRTQRAWIGGLHNWFSAADDTIKLLAGPTTKNKGKRTTRTLEIYVAAESLGEIPLALGEVFHHLLHLERGSRCRGYNRESDDMTYILQRRGFQYADLGALRTDHETKKEIDALPIDWSVFDDYREGSKKVQRAPTMLKVECECNPPSRLWIGSQRVLRRGVLCERCGKNFAPLAPTTA